MQPQFTPEELSTEEWRTPEGYPNIEVSNLGRVRLYPTIGHDGIGYRTISIHRDHVRLHHLVTTAYYGVRPPRHVSNHKDGDKTNNRRENLEWVTYSENVAHAHRTGLRSRSGPRIGIGARGEKNPAAKLTEDKVRFIKNSGMSAIELAGVLDVSAACIRTVLSGRRWAWVR